MANLIPPHAKKNVIREYWMRVAAVWTLLTAAVSTAVVVLMVPTYILVERQQAAYANQFEAARSEQDAFEAARDELSASNDLLRHIRRANGTIASVPILETVDTLARARSVTIRQFTFRQSESSVEPVVVIGEAADRTALASFRDAIEAEPNVASVELPISNLAGGTDIAFSMTIELTASE